MFFCNNILLKKRIYKDDTFNLVLHFSVDSRSTFFMQLYCSFYFSFLFKYNFWGAKWIRNLLTVVVIVFETHPSMFFLETKPCLFIHFLAYKCRCTRKGPKIRYKDVQKLEIKPKHPYCQEKMILWVGKKYLSFISLFWVCNVCLVYFIVIFMTSNWNSLDNWIRNSNISNGL